MDKATFASSFRIALIGKNQDEKAKLGMFLTAKPIAPYGKLSKQSSVFRGEWKTATVMVFNTPDLYSSDETHTKEDVTQVLSQCPAGPNVLLLLVNPRDFSKKDRDKLKSILRCFGEDAAKYSMIILTENEIGWVPALHKLKQDCEQKHFVLNFHELSAAVLKNLMEKVEMIVNENQDLYEAFRETGPIYHEINCELPLNIVFCGRYRNWKTTATSSILEQKIHCSLGANGMKHLGQIDERTVSITELPPLTSLKKGDARQEALQCISLCEPEGIHAFVMVQPVGPLDPEDKLELDAIRREFTSKMNDFTMVLFLADSDSVALAVANFIKTKKDIQELCESCNNRYVIYNVNSKEQVQDVIKMVMTISQNGSKSFTKQMAIKPRLGKEESFLKTIGKPVVRVKKSIAKDALRIVLVGKTGSGKSATANTLLGRKTFESKLCQTSVTKVCGKAEGMIDGRSVVVVDTPGLFDTVLSNDQVRKELVNCVSLLSPGPHVFLLVLKLGRFTKEAQETVELIKNFFGKAMESYTIVVFTCGDELENQTLESYLEESNSETKAFLKRCGNRQHVLNNKAPHNRKQVKELLKKMEALVLQNGNGYFTSTIFEEAEKAIEKEAARILKVKEPVLEKQRKDLQEKHMERVKITKSKILEIRTRFEHEITQQNKQVQQSKSRLVKEQENRRIYEERRKEEDRILKEQEEAEINERSNQYADLVKQINKQSDSLSRSSLMSQKDNMKRNQEAWERKKQEWRAKRLESEKKREEENNRLKTLEREYQEEKKKYEQKKREDDERRRKDEQEMLLMQEKYQQQMDEIRQLSEEGARRQAEMLNDFQRTFSKERSELHSLREKQKTNDENMLKLICKNKSSKRDLQVIKLRQKKEIEELEQIQRGTDTEGQSTKIAELQRKHSEEIHEWIQEQVSDTAEGACAIL